MVKYSFIDIIRNSLSLVYTKCFYPKARLIRWPLFRSGAMFKYGKGLTLGRGCRIDVCESKSTLFIGDNARIGDYVHINADVNIHIGNNVLMASKIFISDVSHGAYSGLIQSDPNENPNSRELVSNSVYIGDNVWIGENVVILPGTKVGDGCVIGANSVLCGKTYHPNSIIVGSPGVVIKKYSEESKCWERI